jgi:hypothetical protein
MTDKYRHLLKGHEGAARMLDEYLARARTRVSASRGWRTASTLLAALAVADYHCAMSPFALCNSEPASVTTNAETSSPERSSTGSMTTPIPSRNALVTSTSN